MSTSPPRDRFDDLPKSGARVGAHRGERPRTSKLVVFLWALVATIALTAAGIVGFLVLSQQDNSPIPSPEASATVDQTPQGELDTSYTVLVLDGTANDDVTQQVADEIVAAGFAEGQVVISPSATTDFETTTVYYATADDESAAFGLANAIGATDVVQSDAYSSGAEDAKELTVVTGLDFAAS